MVLRVLFECGELLWDGLLRCWLLQDDCGFALLLPQKFTLSTPTDTLPLSFLTSTIHPTPPEAIPALTRVQFAIQYFTLSAFTALRALLLRPASQQYQSLSHPTHLLQQAQHQATVQQHNQRQR